ncbi:MAG: type II toxin-antitoxin system death-on-curing family toxin [Clostridiaceae bacterium]|nr:type II toxin-antitoxin system death-on-curing family toxin [Clostridiaceae bacterium]
MTEWRWVSPHLAITWHARVSELYGGAPGLRDPGLLESALMRPRNLVAYGEEVSTERLAALYGVGIAKAHAFVDGNKRVAFAVLVAFLKANGRHLDVTETEATRAMLNVAAGAMDEVALHEWIVKNGL